MANEYYLVKVGFNSNQHYAECDFTYRITDPSETDDWVNANALYQALDDGGPGVSWLSKLQALLSQDSFISSIVARRIYPTGGNSAGQAFEVDDLPGAVADTITTGQIAWCIIWSAGEVDTYSGRNFIPFVPENRLESSRWTGAATTSAEAFITKHIVGHSTAGGIFMPCIIHSDTHTGELVSGGYLSPTPGTQKRREVPI